MGEDRQTRRQTGCLGIYCRGLAGFVTTSARCPGVPEFPDIVTGLSERGHSGRRPADVRTSALQREVGLYQGLQLAPNGSEVSDGTTAAMLTATKGACGEVLDPEDVLGSEARAG